MLSAPSPLPIEVGGLRFWVGGVPSAAPAEPPRAIGMTKTLRSSVVAPAPNHFSNLVLVMLLLFHWSGLILSTGRSCQGEGVGQVPYEGDVVTDYEVIARA